VLPPVDVVNAVCCAAILALGSAYYLRTRHMDLSHRAADRRARLYVLLLCGVGLLGLGDRLTFDVAILLR
jgi:hypothetical protein